MDAPATLVWIAPAAPDADQVRSLASWALAHGVTLEPPNETSATRVKVDPSVAGQVEAYLEAARDALAARDAGEVDRALAGAEALLRDQPGLPESAWLRAEVERTRSTRKRRISPIDPLGADAAWLRAEALDRGRAPGVGEEAPSTHPAEASLVLDVIPPSARIFVDGAPEGSTIQTRVGPHAVVVTWNGAPVWAEWIETAAGSSTVRIVTSARPPCSAEDVGSVRATLESVDASGVQCPRWVFAMPATRLESDTLAGSSLAATATLRIATCEKGRCGALLDWRSPTAWAWSPPPEKPQAHWPGWATWGLIGAGAAVAGAIAVTASGALKAAPAETRFVIGGIKTH